MQTYLYGSRRVDMEDNNVHGFSCFIGYSADGVEGDKASEVFASDSMAGKCGWHPMVGSLVNVDFTPKGRLSSISTVKEK